MIVSLAKGPNGGIDVPEEALLTLWTLADRDLVLTVAGEKLRLTTAEGSVPKLSEDEKAAIVRWKKHLMVLVAYEPPAVL